MSSKGLGGMAGEIGNLYVSVALTTYIIYMVFDNLNLAGATAIVNTTIATIQTGAYSVLVMMGIVGVVYIGRIVLSMLRG